MKAVISLTQDTLHQIVELPEDARLTIDRVVVDCSHRSAEFFIHIDSPDALGAVGSIRARLQSSLNGGVRHIVLRPRFAVAPPLLDYLTTHWPDIMFDIGVAGPKLMPLLESCRHSVRDTHIECAVCDEQYASALEERGCADIIRSAVMRDTACECTVAFTSGDFSSQVRQTLEERRRSARQHALEQARSAAAQRERVIYSSDRAQPTSPLALEAIMRDKPLGRALTIHGMVVSCEGDPYDQRGLRFIVTDFTSSIECLLRLRRTNGDAPASRRIQLDRGDWVSVSGRFDLSQRNEYELTVERIERIDGACRDDTAERTRVELHAHTKMSQMDGLTELSELFERAARWRHPAIGLTDHGNVHVFPDAYALGRKHSVKPLLGMEGYLINRSSDDVARVAGRRSAGGRVLSREEQAEFKRAMHHIILYVRNRQGLRNLYNLVSLSHCQYFYNKPLLPRDVLAAHREGLLIGTACECGEIYRLVLDNYTGRLADDEFQAAFNEKVALYDYLEIQPRANNMFYVNKGVLDSESDLEKINLRIYELGRESGKPVVATGDVHVLDEHDALLRRVLQIGQGYDKETDESDTPLYFMTTDEMLAEFAYLGPERATEVVVDNPRRIAEMVEDVAPIPDGFHPPTLEGAQKELTGLCAQRCRELYGESPHPVVTQRLDKELTAIIENHFADLYILAQKVVRKSLDDGYIVGSRGSVGSSFVAFLSGITEVNSLPAHYTCPACFHTDFIRFDEHGNHRAQPLDGIEAEIGVDLPPRACPDCGTQMHRFGFDIPFETFVGFKGDKTPDIDLNFASEYQSRAHQYIEELFGTEHVYRAGTISTLRDKTAFGFVQRYLEKADVEWPKAEIERVIQGLTGIKRTTGQHPGGMIILPHDRQITEFCPVHFPANKAASGSQTTHFDYHAMEDQLLKLDILGHDDPTQIRLLSDYTGRDITQVPLNDKATLLIFSGLRSLKIRRQLLKCSVGTHGIPEFGTEFVRKMLEDTRPKTFADLVRISGLSHGNDVWIGNAREIIRAGHSLKDAICTRDDILLYLTEAGLDPFDAFKIMEQVRKGRGLSDEQTDLMRAHNVPEWYIDSCLKIKYMFPKAHAVAYVINAVRIAYCKVHFPAAYYATYFTVMRHTLDAPLVAKGQAAIREAIDALLAQNRRTLSPNDRTALVVLEVALEMAARGIVMRPIDVYRSDAAQCVLDGNDIIPPLTAFPGLGHSAAETIVAARKAEPFTSREDFQQRTRCNRSIVEAMAAAGIFGDMPESDQMDLF